MNLRVVQSDEDPMHVIALGQVSFLHSHLGNVLRQDSEI